MRRKLFYGKGNSLMTRKFDYEKEVVLWKRKFSQHKCSGDEKHHV